MRTRRQLDALRATLRCAISSRRGESGAAARLGALSRVAREAGVPARMLLPTVSIARVAMTDGCIGEPPEVADRARVETRNLATLERLGEHLDRSGIASEQVFLLGDAALAALLYDDLAAFPLRLAIGGLPGVAAGTSALDLHLRLAGGGPALAPLGPLAGPAEADAGTWVCGRRTWRLPGRELLLALLLARLGDPLAHPDPPLWHHLALAVGTWEGSVDARRVGSTAVGLGLGAAFARGAALLSHLFPELASATCLAAAEVAPRVSRLERALAVPLASHKLVATALRPDEAADAGAPSSFPALQPS